MCLSPDCCAEPKYFSRLSHPSLTNQLSSWIGDSSLPSEGRRRAIDISLACSLTGLAQSFTKIALNENEPHLLRTRAAMAIAESGDDNSKIAMRSLALANIADDPNDELKAAALSALWPGHISAAELFGILTPARGDVTSVYHLFVRSGVPGGLSADNIDAALRWALAQSLQRDSMWRPHAELLDEIIWKAWESLDVRPDLVDVFADVALNRSKLHDHLVEGDLKQRFQQSISERVDRRRHVFSSMTRKLEPEEPHWAYFLLGNTRFVLKDDLGWVLQQSMVATDSASKRLFAQIALRLVDQSSREDLDLLTAIGSNDSLVTEILAPALTAIDFKSPDVDWIKEAYERQLKARAPAPLVPPERLASFCEKTISENPDWWFSVVVELYRDDPDAESVMVGGKALSETPGWIRSGPHIRRRVLQAAKHYILTGDPRTSEWLGTGQVQWAAYYGHEAFRLALREDSPWLETLAIDTWCKWAATNAHHHVDEFDDQLIRLNYSKSSTAVLDAMLTELNGEASRGYVTSDRVARAIWDREVENKLIQMISAGNFQPRPLASLVGLLVTQNLTRGLALSRQLFEHEIGAQARPEYLVPLAAVMFGTATEASWELLWPIFQDDANFGRAVIEDTAYIFKARSGFSSLPEGRIADLYVWMVGQYPYRYHPRGPGIVTPEFEAEMTRDSLLTALKNRQSFQAVDALKSIQKRLPEQDWMRFHIREGEQRARIGTWQAPSPSAVLECILHQEKKVVQSAADLQRLTLESLDRLQSDLRAASSAINGLWDERTKGKYRPKDEGNLSNLVKRPLERELTSAVVNREVQVSSTYGAPSENTDICVSATTPAKSDSNERVSVIIEVKGCWNADVWSAMEDQLVNRYLMHSDYKKGIYLVGWFSCDAWDKDDSRQRKTLKISAEQAKGRLAEQAHILSACEVHVDAFVLDCGLP